MYHLFQKWRQRRALVAGATSAADDIRVGWPKIRALFASERTVFVGPVGANARLTPQFEILCLIAVQGNDDELLANCEDDDPVVAAYCCEALFRCGSDRLQTAVRDVERRRDKITSACGSSPHRTTLGEFASGLLELATRDGGESQEYDGARS